MRGNIIVIGDGGGGSSSNERKRSQTATSASSTTQAKAAPSAQARGNSNVIQINDGGGYGSTAKSASTTPNPMPSAQARGNQHVVQINDGGGYGKTVASKESGRSSAGTFGSLGGFGGKGTETRSDHRMGLAFKGGTQKTAANLINLGGLTMEAAAPGNQRIQRSRAETGNAFGDGFWRTTAQMLINNPSSGNANADVFRSNLTAIDDSHVPQMYEAANRLSESGTAKIERAERDLNGIKRAIVDISASAPELIVEVGANALLPGSGTAFRAANAAGRSSLDYRQNSGEDYDTGKALLRAGLTGGGVMLGEAASKAVGVLGNGILQNNGWQGLAIPNAINHGVSASAYSLGEVGGDELGRATTEDSYTPDWNRIGNSGVSAFAFAALDDLTQGLLASARDKARIRQDIADVRQSYEAAMRALHDPSATPEQRAQLAQSTIDNANWMSRQLDEMDTFGARRKLDEAQGVLDDIIEGVRPYTSAGSEWTNGYDPVNIMMDDGVSRFNVQHQEAIISSDIQLDGASLYDSAKNGDRHAGIYQDALLKSAKQLERSINSHTAQVEEHMLKIQQPDVFDSGWNDKSDLAKAGLIRKWNKDLKRNAEQALIEIWTWKERFGNEQ